MFGSHGRWDIRNLDMKVEQWLKRSSRPLKERIPKVVFRGGYDRTCSFPPDRNNMLDWLKKDFDSQLIGNVCGRQLLMQYAQSYPNLIDYQLKFLSMDQQRDDFKYTITVEGHGGWADRLFEQMFYDMGLFVQEHPCPEWYEYMFKPFQHYIPVANDFSNILGRIDWAEHHPLIVQKMIEDRRALAQRVLSEKGLLTFSLVLWVNYCRLLTYDVLPREGLLDFGEISEFDQR
jgi:hypothetical protein